MSCCNRRRMTNRGSASTQQRASAPISQLSHPDFQTSEPELKPRPAVLRGVSSRDPQRFAASPAVPRESPSIVLTSLLKTSLVLVPATNNSSELYDKCRTHACLAALERDYPVIRCSLACALRKFRHRQVNLDKKLQEERKAVRARSISPRFGLSRTVPCLMLGGSESRRGPELLSLC